MDKNQCNIEFQMSSNTTIRRLSDGTPNVDYVRRLQYQILRIHRTKGRMAN